MPADEASPAAECAASAAARAASKECEPINAMGIRREENTKYCNTSLKPHWLHLYLYLYVYMYLHLYLYVYIFLYLYLYL